LTILLHNGPDVNQQGINDNPYIHSCAPAAASDASRLSNIKSLLLGRGADYKVRNGVNPMLVADTHTHTHIMYLKDVQRRMA